MIKINFTYLVFNLIYHFSSSCIIAVYSVHFFRIFYCKKFSKVGEYNFNEICKKF